MTREDGATNLFRGWRRRCHDDPVSLRGDPKPPPNTPEYAANDILVDREVDVLTAPVCEMAADRAVTCTGETFDGEPIEVLSAAGDQSNLTITVGGTVLFEGAIQDVLDDAIRPGS